MATLKLIIEIALDADDTDGKQAASIVTDPRLLHNASLFVGDAEFMVTSISLD